jgi:hypothetical protein
MNDRKTIESVQLRLEAYEEQRDKLIMESSKNENEMTKEKAAGLELRHITERIKTTKAELETYKLAHAIMVGETLKANSTS